MIRVGDKVPMAVQLYDGNPGAKVEARIFDPIGKLLASYDLAHVEKGLYSLDLFTMPDVEYIKVQYLPDDLENYSMGFELFMSKPKGEKVYTGEIIESTPINDRYEGLCEN